MSQIQLYKIIYFILYLFCSTLLGVVHKPIGDEQSIKLKVSKKERIYYELTENGLLYQNIGKHFNIGDSIKIGIHSRSIKAPTGRKRRIYGFKIHINKEKPFELLFKKGGSKVFSPDRPGWNYTKSGVWYIYIPVKESNTQILIEPLKGNPVVYIRLTSNSIRKKGQYTNVLETVNKQKKIMVNTGSTKRKYFLLEENMKQQFEIQGPSQIRVFSRLVYDNLDLNDTYYLLVKEDGVDLGNYYFKTEKSKESFIDDSDIIVSKWRSLWLNVPVGYHYYTFSLPIIDDNKNNKVLIRLKEWSKK